MGNPMSDTQKEAILQLVALGHTKTEIAKTIGVDLTTVYRFLKKQKPEELKESRREALERIASKISKHVEDSIEKLEVPEEASYVQRMTGIGIGTDKVIAIDKQIMAQEAAESAPQVSMLPTNIEALVGAIRNDLKSLDVSILRVHLDKGDAAMVEGLSLETPMPRLVVDAEVTSLDDLDVGGTGGA